MTLFFAFSAKSTEYEDAWKAINRNDIASAKDLLTKAMKVPETAADAYSTYLFLKEFESKSHEIEDYSEKIYALYKNPYPYIYSMWFNDAVLGPTGMKNYAHQLKMLDKLLADPNCNGTLKSSAHYMKGFHLLCKNKIKEGAEEWALMGTISSWKFVGPFDNLSQSGFYKKYEPILKPEENNTFKSLNNSDIQWFEMAVPEKEGWNTAKNAFSNSTAIIFAQSFVYSPDDQKVVLCAGGSGSLKVWVNDEIVIAESKERATELDTYKSEVTLKKGYNRILVQLGFTDSGYPNFAIRLTDDRYLPIKNITVTPQYQKYTSLNDQKAQPSPSIPLFAETYFIDKIKAEPDNLLNYLLLGKVYTRNEKSYEARRIYEQALKKAENNSILKLELINCLSKTENRTKLLELAESIKETDPKCQFSIILKMDKALDEKKFDEFKTHLKDYVDQFGEDETVYSYKIKMDEKAGLDNEMINDINMAHQKYPASSLFTKYYFYLKSERQKDSKGALKVYESYLKDRYSYEIRQALIKAYFKQGMIEKGQKMLEESFKYFPFDPESSTNLAIYFYNKQDYGMALKYCKNALAQRPYTSTYWSNLGSVYEALGKKEEAIESDKKAVYYSPNLFNVHQKIRQLENKLDLMEAFPKYEVNDLIKKSDVKDTEHDYYYVTNDQCSIVYPEGTNELYRTIVVKILNRDGIDFWKNVNIPYNPNTQDLKIEKSEVVKANGNKIAAETNNNEFVFSNLEIGDAITLKYKVMNYSYGRLAREFWDNFNFSKYQFVEHSRYSLLIAKNIKFSYKMINDTIQPEIKDYDKEYTLYTWERTNIPAIESEPYMPPLSDIGSVLHISSVQSWQQIAEWYNDLSSQKTEDDIEVKDVYDELFPMGASGFTEMERAKIIYNYIAKNMNYSSVAFRQSGYVPQSASKTISTHLGDCKDLSSLFVALSKMAGLKSNLVLIDTRDNGAKEMVLPSFDFNHCIAKLQIGKEDYFLEMTDKTLPFKSLPNNLYGALALNISGNNDQSSGNLINLEAKNRTKNKVKRVLDINVDGSNLLVTEKIIKIGNLTSQVRTDYATLSEKKQKEEIEKIVHKRYGKVVNLNSVSFRNLENTSDSIECIYNYVVQDALIDIGNLQSFQINYPDVIATLNHFTKETRDFPVEYWSYEDTDNYDTEVNISVPAGKTFVQLPSDQKLKFGESVYSIQFKQKSPNQLTITRKANLDRKNIDTSKYKDMRAFFDSIVKMESKYIVMK